MSNRFHAAFLLIPLAVASGAMAQTHKSLTRPAGAGQLPASAKPLGKQQLTVVLKLADDSVATVRSRAPGKKLALTQRKGIAQNLRIKQDAMIPMIQARGGKVLAKMQHAINGIKVRTTADKLPALAAIPGVVGIKSVITHHLTNASSVPFIGADAEWGARPGFRGEGIKIAVIDTGIDYTHANFGGPGTIAAFTAAAAHSTDPADPSLFGPAAPKVKGGTDLVGDAYNADDPTSVPVPDPNPLDCNGHGSHTAGTAGGFGVTSAGSTFHGPYNASTPNQSFTIGPGVAPLADLYSVRVFGCAGSTNVVDEAIDWAVANEMDVINMSLGSDFGTEDSSDAEASEAAANAGVIVVASAGNAGTNIPYSVGSPSTGDKTISVAAIDSHASFPGATLALSTGSSLVAINANGAAFTDGTVLPVVVLYSGTPHDAAHISLGCDPAEYTAAGVTGKMAVVRRGTCARVARAIFGQQAGAAAVVMVNSSEAYPPYEGPITSNPDTGEPFTVTIPFLGVPLSGGPTLVAADGGTATLSHTTISNPTFRSFASFSSSGPRTGDGHLKPNISAPGVSVFSTAVGTGTNGLFESGTSMAAPHVAGTAALARQAHPFWSSDQVRLAVENTSDPSQLSGYIPSLGGAGLVQPFPATRTNVVASSGNADGTVSFGLAEFTRDFSDTRVLRVHNLGGSRARFSVSALQVGGSPHDVSVEPEHLNLRAGASERVRVKIKVPAATVGDASAFREVGGIIQLSPDSDRDNNGAGLTVPYYLVPRARSEVDADLSDDFGPRHPNGKARVRNESHILPGTADFYAWNLHGENRQAGHVGLRAVGVQSFDAGAPLGQVLVFAVSTFKHWSNAATTVFDLLIDVDGDGVADFDVETGDLGILTGTGSFTGEVVSAVFDLKNGGGFIEFDVTAPTDGSTMLIPIVAAHMGVTPSSPRFRYIQAQGFDIQDGSSDVLPGGGAGFNAFDSAVSTGAFAQLDPGAQVSIPLTINPAEFRITRPLGVMMVSLDNRNRGDDRQAQLLRIRRNDSQGEHEGEHQDEQER